MYTGKEEIRVKGKNRMVDSARIAGKTILLTGRLFSTAALKDEWYDFEGLMDPRSVLNQLRKSKGKPDLFTFMQRLPHTERQYDYHTEWDSVAVLNISSFDHWWEKQIPKHVRKNVKKASRKGVSVKVVDFNDDLALGITSIYNESPIRQGKPFWHYGKDFETVKKETATYLENSDFIGAYHEDELIGFIKLVYTQNYACTMHVISKIAHRDKAPVNALLAHTVELCHQKQISYLSYGEWSMGTLGDFKRYNGFEKVALPRYYIPLTMKGHLILRTGLHRGITSRLPDRLTRLLVELRGRWYRTKLQQQGADALQE
jgi:hypothetical protein